MRVTGFMNSLCAGGSQRQMVLLAKNLQQRGLDFRLVTYQDHQFFKPAIDEAGIPHVQVEQSGKLARALKIYRLLRQQAEQVVVSFLDAPNVYAELATLPDRRFGLIASERSGFQHQIPWQHLLRLRLHHRADFVVANSSAMIDKLADHLPSLLPKSRTIRNCVDLEHFTPQPLRDSPELHLLVLARFSVEKNPLGVLEAFRQARARSARPIVLDWYGDTYNALGDHHPLSQPYRLLREKIGALGLADCFRLHDQHPDPQVLLRDCHAVLLASFFEGCSNVVCEALACGRALLVSNVGDNSALVIEGRNGLLFDPRALEKMTAAIVHFAGLSAAEQWRMGQEGRAIAERLLSESAFCQQWLDLIKHTALLRGFRF